MILREFKISSREVVPYLIKELNREEYEASYDETTGMLKTNASGNMFHYCLMAAHAAKRTIESGFLHVTHKQAMRPGEIVRLLQRYNKHGYVILRKPA